MAKLDELKAQLLPFVKQHAHIKLSQPIQLASGKMSNTYFDGRQVTLHPEGMSLFARSILEVALLSEIHAVGGPSIGADPIATAVSLFAWLDRKITLPAFLVRKEPKKHGLQRQIEGPELKPGMRVLVVEDVITSGKSVLQAISAIETLGAIVAQVVCLVDRNEGGREALSKYVYQPIFTRDEVEK
ncbi:MAG: orotate phosphoribosyltransferase [Omnitrophica bacterium RIFCSPLOWO2_12_FULL_44_17]|uniref:Orotate phosphoribosyltransferase n=1 Tax=Candidatus Danuiimicrobium aquiferis TaxID=1801832 RepID=A0A1G1KV56_9BACT|nr:MAG: orotate phosphoribosyltransferase [Omnitrophica bacterium RIFCSPHIGHO2_02_FULL_45_28]OGW88558.1 MAG: orotate phosphoribosyltransferase [Omnitrophica bacterium RIFCSPHIGHO2_12_FULL_44_12]OGW96823.1 MAG: orotate phosphoribosyltransferase [Omnitrophica bacterium RIFCSPLOWO2_12_FULL_44_17]OGX03825.1 MAG: orotate phosphoribosyltransferase [Omnitrophica bacterium RIFCSPLOWO2_02_FULL_44_11]